MYSEPLGGKRPFNFRSTACNSHRFLYFPNLRGSITRNEVHAEYRHLVARVEGIMKVASLFTGAGGLDLGLKQVHG